eukprot:2839256-Amphidinium_carterae.1
MDMNVGRRRHSFPNQQNHQRIHSFALLTRFSHLPHSHRTFPPFTVIALFGRSSFNHLVLFGECDV